MTWLIYINQVKEHRLSLSQSEISCIYLKQTIFFKINEALKCPNWFHSTALNQMRLHKQQRQYLLDMTVNDGLVTSSETSFSCSDCLSFWSRKCRISSFLHSDCSSCVSISSRISSELRERSTTRTWARMDGWISEETKQEKWATAFSWVRGANL